MYAHKNLEDTQIDTEQRQQAYFIQYTTLMITLLAFVIGSFASSAIRDKNKATELSKDISNYNSEVSIPTWQKESSHNQVTFQDLFKKGTAELNFEKAQALVDLLNSHDLYAKIKISWDNCPVNEESSCISKAFKRMEVFDRFLSTQGIPNEIYSLFVVVPAKDQISIAFYG
jgi:hypothetical protein